MNDTAGQAVIGEDRYRRLIDVGIALSAEKNHDRLMEMILLEAKSFYNADGGTLYLMTEDQKALRFTIMRNDALNIAMGGTTGKPIPFPPLPLYDAQGKPRSDAVAVHAALTGNSINIPDVYAVKDFDFTGAKKFDAANKYRTTSSLVVPLKDHKGEVMGVIQLINALDAERKPIPFDTGLQPLIEALASQAAVALNNQQLLAAQIRLFNSFIKVISTAIDAKSPYTGGHCLRVPEITRMLCEAACDQSDGPFADFTLSDDQWYELEVAAGLHDCGKVTTPEYVVDKATKLETIYNRIHEIRMRFEVIKRDRVIRYLEGRVTGEGDTEARRQELEDELAKLDDEFAFVAECNVGGEFMAPEKVARLKAIGERTWTRTLDDTLGLSIMEARRMPKERPALPVVEALLADKPEHRIEHEVANPLAIENPEGFTLKVPELKFNLGELHNLAIARGTLSDEDRFHINNHIVQTILMLKALPFPKNLKAVPELAGCHHETMNGKGYPRSLKREDMSVPARIMAIADVFEALTASDRPYKPPKTLSDSLKIMSFMCKDGHLDPDLFNLFLSSGVWKIFADKFLKPEQIDAVDIEKFLFKPAPPKTAAE